MDAKVYKIYHEEYMMHNTGTSAEECTVLLSMVPFNIFLSMKMTSLLPRIAHPFFEFCLIVIPVILNLTIFSDLSHLVLLSTVVLCATIVFVNLDSVNVKKLLNGRVYDKKNILTVYRASTNFVSAICILSVDFTVFPKRFAKTESFGFGLMDLGVGFFVCSHGFVEKHPCLLKNEFFKICKKFFVFLTLGVLRLASVKFTNYQEHVTEYGLHWNFFFTLAFCHLFVYIITLITNSANPLWLAMVTGLIHQIFLTLGLQQWVLSDNIRNSFFSANKEGLTSCLGFVCLYFASSCAGKLIICSDNSTYKKLLFRLISVCALAWIGTFISFKFIGISRRLANVGYVFWIMALSLNMVILLVLEEFFRIAMHDKEKGSKNICMVPCLLQSINANGLFFFLFSNLLTGIVNLIFPTLLLGKTISLIIIISYMVLLCGATYFLYAKKIFFKF